MDGVRCPSCQETEFLVYHASYTKYWYEQLIVIIRVICIQCQITHALIPAFSLPGTSIGTQEAQQYLEERGKGVSRSKAGAVFFECGLSAKYPVFFEKMIERCIANLKALLPTYGELATHGAAYLKSIRETTKPHTEESGYILTANSICLSNSINAVLCNRVSILVFLKRKAGIISPLNHGIQQKINSVIDSS